MSLSSTKHMQVYFVLCKQCLHTSILEFDGLFSFLSTLGNYDTLVLDYFRFTNLKRHIIINSALGLVGYPLMDYRINCLPLSLSSINNTNMFILSADRITSIQ